MKKLFLVALTVMLTLSIGLVADAGFNLGNVLGKVVRSNTTTTTSGQSEAVRQNNRENGQALRVINLGGQCDLSEGQIYVLKPEVRVEYEARKQRIVMWHNTTKLLADGSYAVEQPGSAKKDGSINTNLSTRGQYTHGFIWKVGADHFFTFNLPENGGNLQLVRHDGVTMSAKQYHTDDDKYVRM